MNRDELKGKGEQVKGRVKEGIGDLTDDERMRGEGKAEHATGEARETYGKGKRKVGEAVEDLGDRIKE